MDRRRRLAVEALNSRAINLTRINGRTVGSATSEATERAHADIRALLKFLWQQLRGD